MDNRSIGVLDSGVGGLSIWSKIVQKLPNESTIYIADSKHCPYGSKSEREIYQLTKRLVGFLLEKNCKLIVLACNTITVCCLDKLRQDVPDIPIIGTVPVIKTAAETSKNKKIGILSTKQTAQSAYQKHLIQKFANDCEVVTIGTDKLVPFVEKGDLQSGFLEQILKEELQPFILARIDTLALGCSHFPFIKDQIQEILGAHVSILDSGAAIARQVHRVLNNNVALSLQKQPAHILYTTGNKNQFAIIAIKLALSENRFLVKEISL